MTTVMTGRSGGAAVTPVVMTIAGSDSGGGAGIQADLKTFHALGVFGTSAITCVTAQNPGGVSGIEAIDPGMVALQVDTVCEGFPVLSAKTGMLYSRGIIEAVADVVSRRSLPNLVVDPVMVATSKAKLLKDDAIEALLSKLVPLARVVTPNLPEAEIICGEQIDSMAQLKNAARKISGEYGVACVLKGGHLDTEQSIDVLCCGEEVFEWASAWVDVTETHGTGCTFAAAVTSYLALEKSLPVAVERAKAFVADGLRNAIRAGEHRPLGV
ncbi:MAG: bifunctional hydroxymethylpyrimidine kinase/phosphomethylpyrimidine kinase [Kiritimatiellia bacterium]|nr:bifunctional hydroxymethylpyrimidine kinase/phosphomethylpyrimidine kinase [Kiritimatiellia bacterium]